MFGDGMDWVTLVAGAGFNLRPWLSKEEAEAFDTLLPGTFWAQWWRGWNDAAAEDIGTGGRGGDDGGAGPDRAPSAP